MLYNQIVFIDDERILADILNKVSCLYSLPPIYINSFEVESLTSYISRLAVKHSLSAGMSNK
ncbi:hypothetical protein SAMN05443246_4007 [Paenibacillus sp. GP183]|nr:hypothetical protein SAMN05443246_4007 [Paenibacillus sp. GP183]